MRMASIFASFLIVLFAVSVTFTEEQKMSPEMEAMMKMASPGENHKILGKLVGDWEYSNKMWMQPGQLPTESTGTMHAEWMLGGRFIHSVWKGDFMGMQFEGHGTDGYDNMTKKYVSSWVDNMGTGIMHSSGTCDAEGNTCTQSGEMIDPMTGKNVTVRSTSTWLDEKTFKLEMFGPDPSGKEMKSMEIVAKKK